MSRELLQEALRDLVEAAGGLPESLTVSAEHYDEYDDLWPLTRRLRVRDARAGITRGRYVRDADWRAGTDLAVWCLRTATAILVSEREDRRTR